MTHRSFIFYARKHQHQLFIFKVANLFSAFGAK
jgi:hypothetical protein